MPKRKSWRMRQEQPVTEDVYDVEDIVDHKEIEGTHYFLVKWLDYPDSDNTWEPESNLDTVGSKLKTKILEFKRPDMLSASPSSRTAGAASSTAPPTRKRPSSFRPAGRADHPSSPGGPVLSVRDSVEGDPSAVPRHSERGVIDEEDDGEFFVDSISRRDGVIHIFMKSRVDGNKTEITVTEAKLLYPQALLTYLIKKIRWPDSRR